MKTCTRCKAVKPLDQFGIRRRPNCQDRPLSRCYSCMAELSRKYREDHPGWDQERNKRYYAENLEKERERNRVKGLTRDWAPKNNARRSKMEIKWTKRQIVETYGLSCHLCGRAIDKHLKWPHRGSFTLDHVIPLSKGGTNDMENIRPAHAYCNGSKHDQILVSA